MVQDAKDCFFVLDIMNMLFELRDSNLRCIEAIRAWRCHHVKKLKCPFLWQGKNYLLQLQQDTLFLHTSRPIALIVPFPIANIPLLNMDLALLAHERGPAATLFMNRQMSEKLDQDLQDRLLSASADLLEENKKYHVARDRDSGLLLKEGLATADQKNRFTGKKQEKKLWRRMRREAYGKLFFRKRGALITISANDAAGLPAQLNLLRGQIGTSKAYSDELDIRMRDYERQRLRFGGVRVQRRRPKTADRSRRTYTRVRRRFRRPTTAPLQKRASNRVYN